MSKNLKMTITFVSQEFSKNDFLKTSQSKTKLSDSDQCKVQSVSSGDKTTSFRVTLAVKFRHLVSHRYILSPSRQKQFLDIFRLYNFISNLKD